MAEKILVVDDEKDIADLIEVFLKNDGYTVKKSYTAGDALASIKDEPPSLAVLDIMLPDMDGFSLCRRIREHFYFPIIMLTAKTLEQDMVMGLTVGADDYVRKPFQPMELMARIKTQLRRYRQYNPHMTPSGKQEDYDIRGLHISNQTHEVTLNGEEISLTPIEFKILYYLCGHQSETVSAETLFEHIWGEKYFEGNNTVMTHIARLRGKLGEPVRNPKYIKTVWGVGYKIE